MKVVICLLTLAVSVASAYGQQSPSVSGFSVLTSEKIVKNSPFSADAVSESVQTLLDGNRIVRSSTGKLYRNSEGRFRRENQSGSGGLYGTYFSYSPFTTIIDPVVGYRYQLDSNLKTASQALLKASIEHKLSTPPQLTEHYEKIETAEKLRSQYKTASPTAETDGVAAAAKLKSELAAISRAQAPTSVMAPSIVASGLYATTLASSPGGQSKYETKIEKLGLQNIEGVEAEGTRTITTVPAGAIGNERPIESVYETWYSKELQLVVMSKQTDPRFGEQTYRLTNIVRTEPDPSLFSLPTGYRVITETPSVYTIKSQTESELVKAGTAPKLVRLTTKPPPASVIEKPNP